MALLQAVLSDPSQTIVTYPTVSIDDDSDHLAKQNVFQRIRKNWRQFLNILPGILLLWTAGVQILWEIREIVIERKLQDEQTGNHIVVPDISRGNILNWDTSKGFNLHPYSSPYTEFFLVISTWHVGIAIGSVIGAALNKVLRVKWVYTICAVLIFVTAVVNIAELSFDEVPQPFLIADAILAGIIYGINHVTVICHAADNSAREIRGTVVRLIAYSKWFIILWASQVYSIAYPTFWTFVEIAYVYAIVAILAGLAIWFFAFNSFAQSLEKRENEDTIKSNLIKIRNDFNYPRRAQKAVDELKLQLSEDQTDGNNIFTNGNLRPLVLVTGARVLSLLVNNIPILGIITSLFYVCFLYDDDTTDNPITAFSDVLSVVLLLKFLIGFGSIFIADCISLNRVYYITAIIWAVSYIVLHHVTDWLISVLVILVFFIVGLGLEAVSYNQLSEAFPLTKRAWSIAAIHIVECVLEILLLAWYLLAFPAIFVYVIAIVIIVISVCLFIWLPNTHPETLRNARDLFNTTVVRQNRRYELTQLDVRHA